MSSSTIDYVGNKEGQSLSRSSRNSKLYREVYGKYEDLDNLPIEDNTDEIDIEKLRELVYGTEDTIEYKSLKEDLDILDVKRRNIDNQRMYDINKILEKAKNENNKLKDISNTNRYNKNILSTLEIKTLSGEFEIDNDIKLESEKENRSVSLDDDIDEIDDYEYGVDNDNIYMTREFKFKKLNDKISELNASSNPLIDNVMEDSDLSLELFEDLKPTGDTIVTKPILENDNQDHDGDMHSSDTRDIDIIKPVVSEMEQEFFTNSYEFSKKDFNTEDNDDFFEVKKSNNFLKILLLLFAVIVFCFVIVYFVLNYGIGV